MKLQYTYLVIALVLFIFSVSCQEPDNSGHPRILMLEGEEKTIQKQIETSEIWNKIHQTILNECDNIMELEPLGRIMIGRRLLRTSQEYLRRIFYLSYAYRLTGDQKYLDHAEKERC